MGLKPLTFLIFSLITININNKLPNSDVNPFTARDMHTLNRLSSPVLSPDKKHYVYSVRTWNEEKDHFISNLQISSIAQPTQLINLTNPNEDISDSSPLFSPSFPNHIIFLRTNKNTTQIYYMKFAPEAETQPEPSPLTNFPIDIIDIQFNMDIIVFSAEVYFNCNDLQCTADENAKKASRGENSYQIYTELMVRHWDTWYTEGAAIQPLYIKVKLNDENDQLEIVGQPVNMLLHLPTISPPLEEGNSQLGISNDGNLIAFSTIQKRTKMAISTKWDIYLYSISEGKFWSLTDDEQGRCQNPKFSPDKTKLAYLCMNREGVESDAFNFRIYDIEKDKFIQPGYTKEFDPAINDFYWYNDNNQFILTAIEEGHSKVYIYDFNDEESPYTTITNDSLYYSDIIVVDENTLLATVSSYQYPTLIATLTKNPESNTETFTFSKLTDLNDKTLSNFELVEGESFTFKGANNDNVQGWLFKPINFNENKKYPLAYLIHGGPEGGWYPSWSYRWNPQLWSNRGYVVAMINFHGSSGMGIKFQDSIRNNWGTLPFEDLMIGFDYLINTYSWIDADRACAAGASFGGYMVNWIQGNNDDKKFKCFVTHDGDFNEVTGFYATEEIWYAMAEFCSIDNIGCTPFGSDEDREGYEKYSPESRIDHWNTPHLVIHGGKDYRVPITEGISTFTALQLRGVPSRFLYFPDENHWVTNPKNSIKWYDEVLGWMDVYLENN